MWKGAVSITLSIDLNPLPSYSIEYASQRSHLALRKQITAPAANEIETIVRSPEPSVKSAGTPVMPVRKAFRPSSSIQQRIQTPVAMDFYPKLIPRTKLVWS
jgi:hypothetical protein